MIVSLVSHTPTSGQLIEIFEKKSGERILLFDGSEAMEKDLSEADIAITFGHLDQGVLASCQSLKWIFNLSAGMNSFPFAELLARDILLTNVRGIHGPQIAEHVFGIMISFSRRLVECERNRTARKWDQGLDLDEMTGKTLLVIGAGSIGREIARKAKAFDMTVLGIRRKAGTVQGFDEVADRAGLASFLARADFVVLVTPLTEDTYHLVGSAEFAVMKKAAIFINVSRGDTVDEEALLAALVSGRIAGAGLDVFHEEPLPVSSPFWDLKNVLLTPHVAGVSPHYLERSAEIFAVSLARFRAGESLPNRVDLKLGY
jgi:phosphoglycerate dehydrogenase-like enzyme